MLDGQLTSDFVAGMILLSELSRRRIRSINKLIKVWSAVLLPRTSLYLQPQVGRNEVVVVLRVDREKGA